MFKIIPHGPHLKQLLWYTVLSFTLVHGTDLWSHVVRCTTEGVSCLVQVELKLAHAKVYHPEYNTFSF